MKDQRLDRLIKRMARRCPLPIINHDEHPDEQSLHDANKKYIENELSSVGRASSTGGQPNKGGREMIICCKCRREMRCDKNGVGADFGHGHVYPTDRFKCPECGWAALRTDGYTKANHDPEYRQQDEYLEMVQGLVQIANAGTE